MNVSQKNNVPGTGTGFLVVFFLNFAFFESDSTPTLSFIRVLPASTHKYIIPNTYTIVVRDITVAEE